MHLNLQNHCCTVFNRSSEDAVGRQKTKDQDRRQGYKESLNHSMQVSFPVIVLDVLKLWKVSL